MVAVHHQPSAVHFLFFRDLLPCVQPDSSQLLNEILDCLMNFLKEVRLGLDLVAFRVNRC